MATTADVQEMVISFGKYMMEVDMFPVFFFAHFAIGNIVVREDSKHLGPKFPQKHPFVSWLSTLLCGLSGVFVANFLFGDPLLSILQENFLIAYLTIIWYLMNYSPYDIVYKVMMHPTVIIPASILQECLRLRFLYLGVQTAAGLYPKAPLIILVGGIIKGNGYGFLKIVERLLRGHWNPTTNEFLEVTYFAKSGAVASVLLVLHHFKLFKAPIELLYLGINIAFIIGRLVLIIGGVGDPLAPLEAPICRVLFGNWENETTGKYNFNKTEKNGEVDSNKNNKVKSGGSKKGDKKKD